MTGVVEKRLAPGQVRFEVRPRKSKRRTLWEVYDVARGSYPHEIPGFGRVKSPPTQEAAEAEAERLATFYKENK